MAGTGLAQAEAQAVIDRALANFSAAEMRDMPTVRLIDSRPSDVSTQAEAWARVGETNEGRGVIYVATYSDVFKAALTGNRDANIRLAGVIAHERTHVLHGADEAAAYDAEIAMLRRLGAARVLVEGVRRAKAAALAKPKH